MNKIATLVSLALLVGAGCKDDGPTFGAIHVSVATTGEDLDLDGYALRLDGATPRAIEVNGTLLLSRVPTGSHDVELAGVSPNCAVTGGDSRSMTVRSGQTAAVSFVVTCQQSGGATAPGSLRISATTSGTLPDPDGYAVCIDPTDIGWDWAPVISCGYGGPSTVDVNGTVTLAVDTSAHTVLLMGVSANCTVAGDNPRTVHVAGGQTAAVAFAVTCAAATLHVTTTTTGASIDPDGYRLCIDPVPDWDGGYICTTEHAVGVNTGVSVLVGLGTHQILLEDVAANCTVGDNPRTVDVAGATQVAFSITCVAGGAS